MEKRSVSYVLRRSGAFYRRRSTLQMLLHGPVHGSLKVGMVRTGSNRTLTYRIDIKMSMQFA